MIVYHHIAHMFGMPHRIPPDPFTTIENIIHTRGAYRGEKLAEYVSSLGFHQFHLPNDQKNEDMVIDVLAQVGVFNVPGVLDHILKLERDGGFTTRNTLCSIYRNSRVKLTDTLQPFHILVALVGDCPGERFNSSKKITRTVDYLIRQKFSIHKTLTYKDGSNQTPLDQVETRLTSLVLKKQARLRLQNLHSILYSRGARASKRKLTRRHKTTQKKHISQWTTSLYQPVQNARYKQPYAVSGPVLPQKMQMRSIELNRHIANVFRNTAIRAPVVPIKYTYTKFLYRGVHGPLAEHLIAHGEFESRGYIAFSRSKKIADRFATTGPPPGIVIRLRISDIPRGTPWIWFNHPSNGPTKPATKSLRNITEKERGIEYTTRRETRNTYPSTFSVEEEVLLPPGTIKLTREIIEFTLYEAEFTPNLKARSLEGKRVYRVPKALATERNEQAALQWYHTLFNSTSNKKRKKPS
jgi:hypothetical protein